MPSRTDPNAPRFQLSTRELVILLLTFVSGVGAGLLLWSAGMAIGQDIIGGFTAAGATFVFFDRITS